MVHPERHFDCTQDDMHAEWRLCRIVDRPNILFTFIAISTPVGTWAVLRKSESDCMQKFIDIKSRMLRSLFGHCLYISSPSNYIFCHYSHSTSHHAFRVIFLHLRHCQSLQSKLSRNVIPQYQIGCLALSV